MKTLDICVPAHNEVGVIASTLEAIRQASLANPGVHARIIVSDNGSSDGTADMVSRLDLAHAVISHPEPGKGAAVKRAAMTSASDYFAYIDADLSIDPRCIFEFIERLESGADIVMASRLVDESLVNRSPARTLSSKLYNAVMRPVLGVSTLDAQCGLKVMNARGREVLTRCEEKTWFQDTEFVLLAHRYRLALEERAVAWVETRFAGRKSKFDTLSGAVAMVPAIARILWRHRTSRSRSSLPSSA